ncbi:MAG: tail fiber domain-containing protein, partial [Marinoscillum sp.]
LEALKSIEITDYTHIDEVNKGRAVHKKVIAQQVEEVFPNAVSRTQGYVPSHYAMAEKQVFDHLTNHMQITCASPHGFEVSDQVKLFGTEGEILVDVLEVIDAMTFVVEVAHAEEQVFVYGKMVDDFRTVDYEAISMLNVSATQQLAKQLEEQQKLIEKLQVENGELKEKLKKVDVLEAKLDIILNMQGDKSEEGTLLGQK